MPAFFLDEVLTEALLHLPPESARAGPFAIIDEVGRVTLVVRLRKQHHLGTFLGDEDRATPHVSQSALERCRPAGRIKETDSDGTFGVGGKPLQQFYLETRPQLALAETHGRHHRMGDDTQGLPLRHSLDTWQIDRIGIQRIEPAVINRVVGTISTYLLEKGIEEADRSGIVLTESEGDIEALGTAKCDTQVLSAQVAGRQAYLIVLHHIGVTRRDGSHHVGGTAEACYRNAAALGHLEIVDATRHHCHRHPADIRLAVQLHRLTSPVGTACQQQGRQCKNI